MLRNLNKCNNKHLRQQVAHDKIKMNINVYCSNKNRNVNDSEPRRRRTWRHQSSFAHINSKHTPTQTQAVFAAIVVCFPIYCVLACRRNKCLGFAQFHVQIWTRHMTWGSSPAVRLTVVHFCILIWKESSLSLRFYTRVTKLLLLHLIYFQSYKNPFFISIHWYWKFSRVKRFIQSIDQIHRIGCVWIIDSKCCMNVYIVFITFFQWNLIVVQKIIIRNELTDYFQI